MSSGNPDVTDRSSRGLQRPWDSAGRHVYILNKPEQLRGPSCPHRKAGTQNWEAGIFGPSVLACVPPSTQGRLCVLDSQDSCCPLFFSHTRKVAYPLFVCNQGAIYRRVKPESSTGQADGTTPSVIQPVRFSSPVTWSRPLRAWRSTRSDNRKSPLKSGHILNPTSIDLNSSRSLSSVSG